MPFFKKLSLRIPIYKFELTPFAQPPGPGELNEFETFLLNFEKRRWQVMSVIFALIPLFPFVLAMQHDPISPKRTLPMGILAIFIGISLFFSILALVGRVGWIRYFMENPPCRERVSAMQIGLRRLYFLSCLIVSFCFHMVVLGLILLILSGEFAYFWSGLGWSWILFFVCRTKSRDIDYYAKRLIEVAI